MPELQPPEYVLTDDLSALYGIPLVLGQHERQDREVNFDDFDDLVSSIIMCGYRSEDGAVGVSVQIQELHFDPDSPAAALDPDNDAIWRSPHLHLYGDRLRIIVAAAALAAEDRRSEVAMEAASRKVLALLVARLKMGPDDA